MIIVQMSSTFERTVDWPCMISGSARHHDIIHPPVVPASNKPRYKPEPESHHVPKKIGELVKSSVDLHGDLSTLNGCSHVPADLPPPKH